MPTRLLLIVSKQLPGVTIYDADTNQQISQAITSEICPHEAAFSLDGQHAYVPIYGNSGVGKPGTDEHTLHIFRTSDAREIARLDTGDYKRPHGITVGSQTGIVYLTAEAAESLVLVDPRKPAINAAIPTGSLTSHMFALTRDESRAYVSNVRSKTISVLDIAGRRLLETIPTEGENQRMTLSPDEQWFVTSLGPAKKIAFYRTKDHALDFTVPVDGTPFVAKFSANGKYLYNAGFAAPDRLGTWKVDVAQRRVVASLSDGLGADPGSLEVNPFTGSVYISDQATHTIYEMDPQAWRVTSRLSAPPSPDCMAFATRS
jgi:DNA-binding beta-propeller fold protein YncE